MLDVNTRVRAVGALICTVLGLIAILSPAVAATDGIHLEQGAVDDDGCHTLEVWNGGALLKVIPRPQADSAFWQYGQECAAVGTDDHQPFMAGGRLYFEWTEFRTDSDTAEWRNGDLWASDGTADGTVALLPLFWSNGRFLSDDYDWFTLGPRVFLYEWQPYYDFGPSALHATRGTVASTLKLPSITPGVPTIVRGRVLMSGKGGGRGRELWVTDGTAGGTRLVKDIRPGSRSSLSLDEERKRFEGRLFFAADDGIHGRELWVTDGTARGTRLVKDLRTGPDGSMPRLISEWRGLLRFTTTGRSGLSIQWVSDGTREGTRRLR